MRSRPQSPVSLSERASQHSKLDFFLVGARASAYFLTALFKLHLGGVGSSSLAVRKLLEWIIFAETHYIGLEGLPGQLDHIDKESIHLRIIQAVRISNEDAKTPFILRKVRTYFKEKHTSCSKTNDNNISPNGRTELSYMSV